MRQLIVGILLISITSHAFRNLGIYIWFKVNQDYIAEYLCIYKDVPMAMCNGSCHLEEKLSESQNTNEQVPFTINLEDRALVLCYYPITKSKPLWQEIQTKISYPAIDDRIAELLLSKRLFRPPEC